MIVGVGDRVEIWSEDHWKTYYAEVSDNLSAMLEKIE